MKKSYTYRVLDFFGNASDGFKVDYMTFYSWPETRDYCRACHSDSRFIFRGYSDKVVVGFMDDQGRFCPDDQMFSVGLLMTYIKLASC